MDVVDVAIEGYVVAFPLNILLLVISGKIVPL